jgi:beta-phosphoglucomutase-like phosphatase (HAD superfamily)
MYWSAGARKSNSTEAISLNGRICSEPTLSRTCGNCLSTSALRATIALASSGKKDEVERYQEIAGIADLTDIATTSDEAEHSKPDPDIF